MLCPPCLRRRLRFGRWRLGQRAARGAARAGRHGLDDRHIDIQQLYLYRAYRVGAKIIERKLRSTKVRLFTVPCCSIILFSSEGMKKTYLNLLLLFSSFYNSGLFYNCVFPHFCHIYQFCSIIIFPFYN